MIQMTLTLGYQGSMRVRRTDLQCSLEKVDERPLRPWPRALMLGQHI